MFRSRRSQLPRSCLHRCRGHPPTSLKWNSAVLSIGSLSESESTCSNVGWVLSRSDTVRLVDVRIGVTQTARELAFEVDDDQRDDLHSRVDAALGGTTDVLWVTDRKGREVAIPQRRLHTSNSVRRKNVVSVSVADVSQTFDPQSRRVAVRPTAAGLRAVRSGDPWLFDGSIASADPNDLPAGSVAVVFDDRRVVGVGLWDPESPIRVKMLHSGGALAVEPRVWVNRLTAALDRRHGLVDDPLTTAWRWVHGENDGLPGLVLDRYVDTLVIKLYSGAWYPHLGDIIAAAQRYCRARGLFFAALGECPLRPVLRVMGMCSLVRGLMEP